MVYDNKVIAWIMDFFYRSFAHAFIVAGVTVILAISSVVGALWLVFTVSDLLT